jgi:hypothetical protein
MAQEQIGGAEEQILHRINSMIDDEKTLRELLAAGRIDAGTEHQRLTTLERELDQCWDLLRQRRAKAQAGQDATEAHVRPSSQVEGYLS